MLPATNTSSAQGTAFPDVCETPPDGEPIPYENTASTAEAEDTAEAMLLSALPAVHTGSTVPSSEGDEAGTMSTNSGEAMFLVGQPTVLIEGCAAVALTTPSLQNDDVAAGAVLVPSTVNVLINLAGGAPDPVALRAELDAARALFSVEGEGVLVARVELLTTATVAAVRAALATHADSRAWVLDLRGCRGGEVEAALLLAGALLPPATPLARERERDGEETLHLSRTQAPAPHPTVVLVDHRTASAAETLAMALQASDRALVVGTPTFGKGTAVTTAGFVSELLTPAGARIHGEGVNPDVEVEGAGALDVALALAATLAGGAP